MIKREKRLHENNITGNGSGLNIYVRNLQKVTHDIAKYFAAQSEYDCVYFPSRTLHYDCTNASICI